MRTGLAVRHASYLHVYPLSQHATFPFAFRLQVGRVSLRLLLPTPSPLGRNLTNAETAHIDRGVIDVQTTLEHHLLQISVAERITKVPANTEQNNLSLEVTPFERGGGIHAIVFSQFSEYRRAYHILAIFATQP